MKKKKYFEAFMPIIIFDPSLHHTHTLWPHVIIPRPQRYQTIINVMYIPRAHTSVNFKTWKFFYHFSSPSICQLDTLCTRYNNNNSSNNNTRWLVFVSLSSPSVPNCYPLFNWIVFHRHSANRSCDFLSLVRSDGTISIFMVGTPSTSQLSTLFATPLCQCVS